MYLSVTQTPSSLFKQPRAQVLSSRGESFSVYWPSQDLFQRQPPAFSGKGSTSRSKLPNRHVKEVSTGETYQAEGKESMVTHGLSDCSAFIFLKNYDHKKKIYRDRVMIHILGSNLSNDLLGKGSAGAAICNVVDQARQEKGPFKMILAYGDNCKSKYMMESIKDQSYYDRQPLRECLALPDLICGEYQMPSCGHSIGVNPQGEVSTYR